MAKEYTKALIYCRVSSEKQVKEGNGLDSQEHRCREYATSLDLEVESVFRDEGISGGLFDRPAMKSLIKYLDKYWQKKYIVIFDDLKRFARDVEVHLKLKAELMGREARLRCLNYHFDDSAEGEFVETIFAAQNQLERKQNRRQVCQKMKARIERGYWCFYPPTGYEYRKDTDHGKLLCPIHPVTNIIAEGLNNFANDRILGQIHLMKFYYSKGLHKLLGSKQIHFEFVKRLLTEPLYAGIVEYPEWGIPKRQGHHEGIVSEETFNKIQEKLKKPERRPRETDNLEFPLRRVVSCDFCGKPMTGSANRSKNPNKYYPHYTCNNKNCSATPKNITASKVENEYLEMLGEIKINSDVLEIAKVIALKMWRKKVKDFTNRYLSQEEEIKMIEKQIDEYVELIPTTKSESIRARYEQKIEGLDERAKELKNTLRNKKEPDFEEALDLALNFLGTPAEIWNLPDRKLRITVHNMIFEENPRYSANMGFGTPKLSMPFYIKHYVTDPKGGLVEVAGVAPASKRLKTYFLQV